MPAGTLVKSVMLKITADDGNTEAKLDAISAKARELGAQHPDLAVKIDTAAATAKLAVLRQELKDTAKAEDTTGKSSTSLKSRLASLGEAAATAGGFGTFSKDASMASKIMSGFGIATGVAEAPMAGLIVGVGGLAAGLVAAGAGLLAFGAVAKSNYTVASTAANQVQTAQIAYNAAITHGTKQATAYKTEQIAIAKAYAQLSPAQITLSEQIGNAQNSWQSFVQSNTSGVAKIMTQGIGLMPKIFASMQPFMAPTEKALGGLVTQLGKGLNTSGFKSFIDMLAKNSGPAITKLGQSIGHIAVGLGGVIKAFMPFAQIILGGLDKITAKFAHWGSTLTSHSGFQSLVSMAKQDMPYVLGVVKNLVGAIKNLGGSMTGLSTFSNSKALLELALPLSQLVNWLSKANPALTRTGLYALAAAGAFGKLKPAIAGISGAVSGIKGAVGAVGDLKKGLQGAEVAEGETASSWQKFGGTLSGVGGNVKSAFSKIVGGAKSVALGIGPALASGASSAKDAMARIGSGLASALSNSKGAIMSAASSIGSGLASAFNATKGAITGAALAIKEWTIWSKLAGVATKIWTGIQLAFNIIMDANPIMLIVIAIGLIIGAIVLLAVKFKPVRDFFKAAWHDIVQWTEDAWHGIEKAFKAIVHAVSTAVSTVINFVKTHWKTIVEIFTGPIGLVVTFIISHWHQITSVTGKLITDVIGFFKSLPGKIIGALGDVGHMLWDAGASIIKGLIGGISSMIGAVTHAIGSVVHEITSHLPFSPAKKGPLSGRGDPRLAGVRIGTYLAEGLGSTTGVVQVQAARVAGAAMISGGGALAGGGGGQLNVQIGGGSGNQLVAALVKELRDNIRVSFGGDVQRWASGR